tara:strand:+ start:431 stop:661 length:231 start_codon:yes stop_codon:yes gene_type:complete
MGSKFLEVFKNITAGPMSTFMGLVFFCAGGYMLWSNYNEGIDIVWTSFDVILFVAGCTLLIKNDEWLKSLFVKNGE